MAAAFSSLLLSVLASSGIHVAVGVDSEVAAGVAPAVIGQKSEPVEALTLSPMSGLKLGADHHSVTISYAPRFFWRRPDLGTLQTGQDAQQPLTLMSVDPAISDELRTAALILHRGQLAHSVWLTPQLKLLSNANLSVGEVNYNAAQDLLASNRNQSRVVRNLVVDLYRYEGQANLEYVSSAQTVWTLSLIGEATGPRGNEASSVQGVLQTSRSIGMTLNWAHRLTHRDTIALSQQTAFQFLQGTGQYVLAQPELGYTRRVSPQTAVTGTVGAVILSRVGLPEPSLTVDELSIGTAEPPGINATGSLRLQSELYRKAGLSVVVDMGGGLDWFLDPIVGQFFPTFAVDASLDVDIGRNWQLDPSISFFSVLDRQPSAAQALALRDTEFPVNYDPADPSDSTRLGWELPIRYRIVPGIFFNAGSRASMRTRRLTSPRFNLTEQVEFWAYLGLTVQLSTEPHGDEDWLYKPEDNATRSETN